jgi:hypothetical protein
MNDLVLGKIEQLNVFQLLNFEIVIIIKLLQPQAIEKQGFYSLNSLFTVPKHCGF